MRRAMLAAAAGAFALTLGAAASARAAPCAFAHDAALDGTPNEIHSGLYPGDDNDNANGDPRDDRFPNTYEAFSFRVPAGTDAGSFTVDVRWGDPRIDFDLYVYRLRPDGRLVAANVASSAAGGTTFETAKYEPRIIGDPVEEDTYVAIVDNWCSRDADPNPDGSSGTVQCGIGTDVPNEDSFTGTVTLGPREALNTLPTVSMSGPDSGRTGARLTYTAQGADQGGSITNYRWDLDGDGFFETNTLTGNVASARFDAAGVYNVGVQVMDNSGDTAYASKRVTITGPPVAPATFSRLSPLYSFKLTGPAFGGREHRALVIRYRLRERSRVTLWLYRGKTRIRRLDSGSRRANHTFRIKVLPRGLRRGAYSVRLSLRSASGKRVRARLVSKLI